MSTLTNRMNEFFVDGMERRTDEVVNTTTEGMYLKSKETNPLLTLDACSIMETTAMAISSSICPENSLNVSTDNLDDKNVKKCVTCISGSILPCTCSCSTNDAGFMVEELTLKNFEKSKLSMVGSFNRTEGMEGRKGKWQNLYNLAGASGTANVHVDTLSKQPVTTGGWENADSTVLPEIRAQKLPLSRQFNQSSVSENVVPPRETTAKPVTASGFSQFFVKNALMEKGVARRNPEACDKFGPTITGQNNGKGICVNNVSVNCSPETDHLSQHNVNAACQISPIVVHEGTNLREWLKPGFHKVNKAESLHIFMQIVKLVDMAHSQQTALQDVRPSCFQLFPSNRVKFVGSLTPRQFLKSSASLGVPHVEHHLSRKRSLEQSANAHNGLHSKHQKLGDNMNFALAYTQSLVTPGLKCKTVEADDTRSIETQVSGYASRYECNSNPKLRFQNRSGSPSAPNTAREKLTFVDFQLEDKWYTSPEEFDESGLTVSSNIYGLGVLLFELLCCFKSSEVHAAAMSDLRHRILPPNFLSENPKETGFCLWLLHPEPSSRPTTREILQSEIIYGTQELPSRVQLSAPPAGEDDAESELLLHFLATLKHEKQKKASSLGEDIRCLEADLEEISKRHLSRTGGTLGRFHEKSSSASELGFVQKESLDVALLRSDSSRLTRNISQLESAYFSVRSQMQLLDANTTDRLDKELIRNRDRWPSVQNNNEEEFLNQKSSDRLGAFFDGLCKYARYNKFEQRAVLRNGDLLNSANVICSLSFDRDEDYFAAAGISKKIKIFDFHALLDDSVDIHYPAIEMTSKSKLSCVCWNNYIKNYLASTDYDGDVQLWDASTGQVFSQYMEHEKRAWSADFSQVDPKKLASGSDDGLVKIWSINEQKSISTIKNVANICCVQFSTHSTNLLAFGSADYKTYCYDLRNTRIPWCTLAGHGKAVSFVKFLDSETLVSASTDNTLKLWDLNKTSSSGVSTSACSLTFCGHTNEKNFVGLTASDGYIVCGSESNEVYAYHRSLPMPITSYKFGSIDPISGQETGDDYGQFVSSVCWRGKSNMIVTANSTGSIKLLQMV